MKKQNLFFAGILLLLLISTQAAMSQDWLKKYSEETGKVSGDLNFYDVKKWAHKYFKDVEQEMAEDNKLGKSFMGSEEGKKGLYIKYKRWEWYWSTRLDKNGNLGYGNAKVFKKNTRRLVPDVNTWKSIGFTQNSGGYWGMGRADCMGFHPTNGNIFYVGSNGGGIWKTTDGGITYTPLGDFLPVSQVGNIIVDFANPNTVYISLAPRGGWMNKSMGIYKSTDAGLTWNPTAMSDEYNAGQPIYDMISSETNSSILLVGRQDGIFRTANGGSSWTKVTDWTCNDLVWKPGSATRVYAARDDYWGSSEVYVSDDAGVTWSKLTNISLPYNSLTLTATAANSNIIAYSSQQPTKSLYVSTNNGSSFTFKSNLPQEQHIFYSKTNANIMYNGGVNVSKSTDGGVTWVQQTHWHSNPPYVEIHADVRNIYHSPVNNDLVYFCNDGGVARYNEPNNQWTELYNGLQITQYYSIACAQTDSVTIIAGSQDNGGSRRNANGVWQNTNGGDAMMQAIDPTDANVMYSTYINGELYRSLDGWVNNYVTISNNIPGGKPNGAWVTPYVLDPNNHNSIVIGYDEVYRSTNRGDTWTKISTGLTNGGEMHSIAVAQSDSRIIYCTGDQKQTDGSTINKFFKTTNQGTSWTSYSSPAKERITQLAVHPTNPQVIWITTGGWVDNQKVFKSTNGGATWVNYSTGLPNVPTNTIVYQPGSNDALYVGNDMGVYYRNSTMSKWESYSAGLPNTVVTDLEIQNSAKLLRASTYGRGAWEARLILNASQIEDCKGVAGGTAAIDGCGVCAGGTTGIVPNTSCCSPGTTIAVQRWNNVSGNYVSDIPVNTTPSQTIYLDALDKDFIGEDDFGNRITGLLCPPSTGTYKFWIASDDASELWLSTNNLAANKVRIAYLDGAVGYKNYDATSGQASASINLVQGQQYYFEVLHKEGGGDAHLAVAWALGNEPRSPIRAGYISQGVTNIAPTVSISSPVNNSTYTAPASVMINVSANDSDGSVTKVEFYRDAVKLGEALSSPYQYIWTNAPAGTYVLTAKATDNLGLVNTSSPVSITVNAPATGDIIGPDCMAKSESKTFSVNPTLISGANNFSWWSNASVQSIEPSGGSTASSTSISSGASFGGGQICVGINYSGAPYYQSFCKNVSLCPALRAGETGKRSFISIFPNPSIDAFILKSEKAVKTLIVTNNEGEQIYTLTGVEDGKVLELGRNFSAGNYVTYIKYEDGSEETLKLIKVK